MQNQNGGNDMIRNKGLYLSKIGFTIILFTFSWCVEPYNFQIKNEDPTLVIESFISDKSYNESLKYPSDGRHFEVNLKWTSDVTNIRDQVVSNAIVLLNSNQGESWQYIESPTGSGKYVLFNEDFKALRSVRYQLQSTLSNGESYESAWEELTQNIPREMGKISFNELTKQSYIYKAGEKTIDNIDGVDVYIDLPPNSNNLPIYYKWNFSATWVYTAPFTNAGTPIHKCWISNDQFLSNYVLQEDNVGSYPQKLVFIQTTGNEMIYKDFSLLITQFSVPDGYYQFWKELQKLSNSGGLFDAPPFNLQTNFKGKNTTKKVSGYFGVLGEQAVRWYFNKDDLSYTVVDRTLELCSISYGPDGPGGPECYNCLDYPTGTSTNQEPVWWKK